MKTSNTLRVLQIFAVAGMLLAGISGAARATVVTYTLSGVTSVFQSVNYTLTGQFNWDTVSQNVTNVNFTVAGTGAWAGVYAAANLGAFNNTVYYTPNEVNSLRVGISFYDYFDGVHADGIGAILYADWEPFSHLVGFSDNAHTTGFATPNAPSPVPAPGALALLGLGLAGIGGLWRKRKAA